MNKFLQENVRGDCVEGAKLDETLQTLMNEAELRKIFKVPDDLKAPLVNYILSVVSTTNL